MTIADRLKDARLAIGLSQEALARKAGLSRTFVSLVERKEQEPGPTSLQALADALHVKARWLRTGEGTRLRPSHPDAERLSGTDIAKHLGVSVERVLELVGSAPQRIIARRDESPDEPTRLEIAKIGSVLNDARFKAEGDEDRQFTAEAWEGWQRVQLRLHTAKAERAELEALRATAPADEGDEA